MCFRCYQNDPAPSDAERAAAQTVIATAPPEVTGVQLFDFAAAHIDHPTFIRTLVRTGKRSGISVKGEATPREDVLRVLRAIAAGEMRA